MIVVDGNDGAGKSTLVAALRARGLEVNDRGAPTKRTDDPTFPPQDGERYLILDVPVEVSRARLAAAGKDLTEQYHTVADLTHYRARFLAVAAELPCCALVDARGTPAETLARALEALAALGVAL